MPRSASRVAAYSVERAAQLSGVPQPTLYDWTQAGVLVPDLGGEHPKAWSYRDLVYARLCLFLRSKQMPRPDVAERVTRARTAFARPDDEAETILRADGRLLTFRSASVEPETGIAVYEELAEFADEFRRARRPAPCLGPEPRAPVERDDDVAVGAGR